MELYMSEALYGVGDPGKVEQVGQRLAKVLRQTCRWIILLDCSNTFNSVKYPDVVVEPHKRPVDALRLIYLQ